MPTQQQSLFGPHNCQCGKQPEIREMPNFPPDERWQIYCDGKGWNHPRAYGRTREKAIEEYNQVGCE